MLNATDISIQTSDSLLLILALYRSLLATAPVQPWVLHVAEGLVRPAPPDENGQYQDDAKKGSPKLKLVNAVFFFKKN